MKLTVLGGAAAGGNPGQGCSGYLVQDGAAAIVLDLGAGTLPELRRHADIWALDAVVVSHLHLDHVLDLLALRYALAYNPTRTGRKLPLWLPPGGRAFLDRVAAAVDLGDPEPDYFSAVYAIDEYDPASGIEIGPFAVAFRATVHYVSCWAMRVDRAGKRALAYTADTGPSADLVPLFAGAAVLVSEAGAEPDGPEPWADRGHLSPAEAGALARASEVETLVLSHYWEENEPERAAGAAAAEYAGPVVLARPGTVVEW